MSLLPPLGNGQDVTTAETIQRQPLLVRLRCPHSLVTTYKLTDSTDDLSPADVFEGAVCRLCGHILTKKQVES